MLDACQGLFHQRRAFFCFEQLGRSAIIKKRKRCVEPMRRFPLIAEDSDGSSYDRNQAMHNLMNCHVHILSTRICERNRRPPVEKKQNLSSAAFHL